MQTSFAAEQLRDPAMQSPIEEAIDALPRAIDRETARDNMVIVRLVTTTEDGR